MTSVNQNYEEILSRVSVACGRAGRDPSQVKIVCVTKFQPKERVMEAAAAGLKLFAESRIQAAMEKLPELKTLGEWHLIGHLQSNKARQAVELFDLVESVDSLKLAQKLSLVASEQGKPLRFFAQVNISAEAQKSGLALAEAPEAIRQMAALPQMKLEGLMGMAAEADDPQTIRPQFAALRRLREELGADGRHLLLSMGMSHDLEAAVAEGADLLRIGSALFK